MLNKSLTVICRTVPDAPRDYTPIEVKWTEAPDASDARHLSCFLSEYPTAERGIVVCRTPRKVKLGHRVTALPWQDLPSLLS